LKGVSFLTLYSIIKASERHFFGVQMNTLMRQKLKSKSGASLVLAILVFLICALVGSTILAAASASSGTITTAWQNDKEVYTLKSTEKIFEQSFTDKTWKSVDYPSKDENGKITPIPTSLSADDMYQYLCIQTYNEGTAQKSLKYTLSDPSLNKTSYDVNVTVIMDDSYNITAVFSMSGSSRTVNLHMSAATGTGDTPRAKGSAVSWGRPVVTVQ